MKRAEVVRHGDTFEAIWPEDGIGIGFTRVRETDSGLIKAELKVSSIRPDQRGLLLSPTDCNLLAATERDRLSGVLTKRAADVVWADALEDAISQVVTLWREPEPLVDLWDIPDPGDLGYLFFPLLVDNETNVWFADEQSMKSYLAAVLAASVATGTPIPGIGRPSRTGTVLYYDWETEGDKQRRRLTKIANGLGLGEIRGIKYRQMRGRPMTECVALIRKEASQLEAVLAIFDSVAWMCAGDLNATSVAVPTMNAVSSVGGLTRLVLGHHSKAGREDENPSMHGSSFFEAASRNRWLIKKSQDEGASTIRLGLYHRKGSDDERHATLGLAFTFDRERNSVVVSPSSVHDDPELLKNASTRDRILAALGSTEFCKGTVEEISKDTGIPVGTVRREVNAMNGTRVTNLNRSAGGRGNMSVWALKAPDGPQTSVQTNRSLLTPSGVNGSSPLRGGTVQPKPFSTVQPERYSEVEDEDNENALPF